MTSRRDPNPAAVCLGLGSPRHGCPAMAPFQADFLRVCFLVCWRVRLQYRQTLRPRDVTSPREARKDILHNGNLQ